MGIREGAYAHSATARGWPFAPPTQEPELKSVVFEVALQEAHLRNELEKT